MKSVPLALLCVLFLACSAGYAAAQEAPRLFPLDADKLRTFHFKNPTPAEKELLDKLYSFTVFFKSAEAKNGLALSENPTGIKVLLARSKVQGLKQKYESTMFEKLDAAGKDKMNAGDADLSAYRTKHLELEVKVAERAKNRAQIEGKADTKDLLSKAEAEKEKWAKAVDELEKATAAEALAQLEKDQKEARKIVESVYAELSKK